jgi:3-phosphoshikimate 1-carboxyvinyltransferase
MSPPLPIPPVSRPVSGHVRPPGSKSITNRALVAAALADGESRLTGVLDSRDTQVMIDGLRRLGVPIDHDAAVAVATVRGCGGRPPAEAANLWLENSGTSIRFLTAVCALGKGTYRLDGNERMRQRPIGDLVAALRQLGVGVVCESAGDCPPVEVRSAGLPGGTVTVSGEISSQYLSALLLAAPCAASRIEVVVDGELVSRPYVEMTLGVMRAFGVVVDARWHCLTDAAEDDPITPDVGGVRQAVARPRFVVVPQTYRATEYTVEPDASAASYFLAAAAITGGSVTVDGLNRNSLQGDVAFAGVLEAMGCRVEWGADSVTVHGGPLRGIDVDMNAISDTAQTLAAVAVFAEGPTRIRNIAHVRHKETDRIAAVATELRRLGLRADEHDDGLTIDPGTPRPAVVQTYDDHRMAMSFALVGLRAGGIEIADPGCTAKTYPRFFDDLARLCGRDTHRS